ncbi:MAG: gluconokinase [Chloroflexi bacterium]|nr:gluconokinase [Chloroflexota bacterium]
MAIVVMGVAGSGKSTVMEALGRRLGWRILDGDTLHSKANVARMAAGKPLTDADREPWLAAIATWMAVRKTAGEPCLVACSALRRSYRDTLRGGNPAATFVHLVAPDAVLAERIRQRPRHTFPPTLLPSQLATLEPLEPDERGFTIDVNNGPAAVADQIVARLDVAS